MTDEAETDETETDETEFSGVEFEPGKLAVLLAVLATVWALAHEDVLSSEAVIGIISSVMGYTAGNGRLALKGWQPAPLLRARRRKGADGDN